MNDTVQNRKWTVGSDFISIKEKWKKLKQYLKRLLISDKNSIEIETLTSRLEKVKLILKAMKQHDVYPRRRFYFCCIYINLKRLSLRLARRLLTIVKEGIIPLSILLDDNDDPELIALVEDFLKGDKSKDDIMGEVFKEKKKKRKKLRTVENQDVITQRTESKKKRKGKNDNLKKRFKKVKNKESLSSEVEKKKKEKERLYISERKVLFDIFEKVKKTEDELLIYKELEEDDENDEIIEVVEIIELDDEVGRLTPRMATTWNCSNSSCWVVIEDDI
jgi:hypothetical protein